MKIATFALSVAVLAGCGSSDGYSSHESLVEPPVGLVLENNVGQGERCPSFVLDGSDLVLGDTCVDINFPPLLVASGVWPRDDAFVYSLVSLPATWSVTSFAPEVEGTTFWSHGGAAVAIAPAQVGPNIVETGTIEVARDDGLTATCVLDLALVVCD